MANGGTRSRSSPRPPASDINNCRVRCRQGGTLILLCKTCPGSLARPSSPRKRTESPRTFDCCVKSAPSLENKNSASRPQPSATECSKAPSMQTTSASSRSLEASFARGGGNALGKRHSASCAPARTRFIADLSPSIRASPSSRPSSASAFGAETAHRTGAATTCAATTWNRFVAIKSSAGRVALRKWSLSPKRHRATSTNAHCSRGTRSVVAAPYVCSFACWRTIVRNLGSSTAWAARRNKGPQRSRSSTTRHASSLPRSSETPRRSAASPPKTRRRFWNMWSSSAENDKAVVCCRLPRYRSACDAASAAQFRSTDSWFSMSTDMARPRRRP
ncbi:hypothetical protein M885DRAFT_518435 [Pelagophyceae sp. CCMP2097]|nr:hypothetical protein M885DRAFT_518435 [Pelagophyceae sp. CCMP2097]|mmetsp:Transcript_6616/g.21380  ORF Transcript_6616/g.21380 Transcript_6616/m.21380 type:complete len:333 (+) Transcript_6616:111-1109(+)